MTDFPLGWLLAHSMHGTIVYLDTYIYHKNPPNVVVRIHPPSVSLLTAFEPPSSRGRTQVGVLVLQLAINWDSKIAASW